MEQTDMVGYEIIDAQGKKWRILDERTWNIDVEVFDQDERGVACRYVAAIDVLAYRMQLAENRRHSSQYRFFDGVVPKLSPDHLQTIAPKFEENIYQELKTTGVTTDDEYESLMCADEGPKDVTGCHRFYIETSTLLTDGKSVKDTIRRHGPVYGCFPMYNTSSIINAEKGYYRPIGDLTEVGYGWASTVYGPEEPKKLLELANSTMHHGVSIIGFGRCVNIEDKMEEDYYVFQNTVGRRRCRMSENCLTYAISPVLPD